MSIRILVIATTLALSGAAMSQGGRLSSGVEACHPLGDFGGIVGFGYGATIGVELEVGPHFSLMAQAGYVRFTGESSLTTTNRFPAYNTVPVQLGGRYYFREDHLGLYLGALGGLHLTSLEGGDAGTSFSGAPLFGLMANPHFDVAIRFQFLVNTFEVNGSTQTNTEEYIGLRGAYVF